MCGKSLKPFITEKVLFFLGKSSQRLKTFSNCQKKRKKEESKRCYHQRVSKDVRESNAYMRVIRKETLYSSTILDGLYFCFFIRSFVN